MLIGVLCWPNFYSGVKGNEILKGIFLRTHAIRIGALGSPLLFGVRCLFEMSGVAKTLIAGRPSAVRAKTRRASNLSDANDR